jgi:uncharacterized membrane protein (DUF485 family)
MAMTEDRKYPETDPGDFTPTIGSATDVAPLGHPPVKPPHERTADEDLDPVDWHGVTQLPEFSAMVRAKLRFVIPATLFFILYYFALPILVGYAPGLVGKEVFGDLNIAYLFALSQFFMAWAIAGLYLRAAARFDRMEQDIVDKAMRRRKGNSR